MCDDSEQKITLYSLESSLKEPVNLKSTVLYFLKIWIHLKLRVEMCRVLVTLQDFILSYSKVEVLYPWAHSSYITLSICSISITCVSSNGSAAAAAVAGLPYRTQASSLSGRTRKNQCNPRHLSAIYNSLVLVPLTTWATFIWDNERKRWDASFFLPYPPQRSFISPSHKADSPLVTPAAASLKIDNKVSEMKTGGQLQAALLLSFKLLGQWRALSLSRHFHSSGFCRVKGSGLPLHPRLSINKHELVSAFLYQDMNRLKQIKLNNKVTYSTHCYFSF